MLGYSALSTFILFGTISADLQNAKSGLQNSQNGQALSKRASLNMFSGSKRSGGKSTWANPETIGFLKEYFSKLRKEPAEDRKKRAVNTVNPEMLKFLENYFVKLENNANQAKIDRNNNNRFNQIVKRSDNTQFESKGPVSLSVQEKAIVDKFYNKLLASASYKLLLESMGMNSYGQSNPEKRSDGSQLHSVLDDKSLMNAMTLLANLKQLETAGGKTFMNFMKKSEEKRSGNFEFNNFENDDKRSENDNEEVDYNTYLDIIKKYDKRATDPMRVESVHADMADQSSNQSFFDRFMTKLFAKQYSKRNGHVDSEDMGFLKRSSDYMNFINMLKRSGHSDEEFLKKKSEVDSDHSQFSNEYLKFAKLMLMKRSDTSEEILKKSQAGDYLKLMNMRAQFINMLKKTDPSSETTAPSAVSNEMNKRFFGLFGEPKNDILPKYEAGTMKHSSKPNAYALANGKFTPYKPPTVTPTSSTYKTVYPLFQKKWSPLPEKMDARDSSHQHPFRLQKRSGGHFSPGTYESPMKASKKNFILDFFRQNKRDELAPMYLTSGGEGLSASNNFHSLRVPFVPVRIAKRNSHYSPSIGPQKRNYRKKSKSSKGRDYFEARSNAPMSRAYFPLF